MSTVDADLGPLTPSDAATVAYWVACDAAISVCTSIMDDEPLDLDALATSIDTQVPDDEMFAPIRGLLRRQIPQLARIVEERCA